MNAFIIMIPLLFIRFGLLGIIDKTSLNRAAQFAPLAPKEKYAYYFYQISNVLILLYSFFLKVKKDMPVFIIALIVYIAGMIIFTVSVIDFTKPSRSGINTAGIYRISRNPMYVGYFVYFLGCVLLTQSWILFILLMIFQISSHWIILSEERWCTSNFGEEYTSYMKKVRRYL